MNLYRETTINVISFLISIAVFFLLEFFIFYFSEPTLKIQANFNSTVSEQQEINTNIKNTNNAINEVAEETTNNVQDLSKEEVFIESEKQKSNWYIEIPAIGLSASIAEGTDKQTMELYIGHFKETSKLIGNVGLAAHNREVVKSCLLNISSYYFRHNIRLSLPKVAKKVGFGKSSYTKVEKEFGKNTEKILK